jgi:transcriptional regulator with XRE-family HTH domain
MMTQFKFLGKFLKQKRLEASFSQMELSEQLEIHNQFISNWERGLCAPPAHSFIRVIEILKVDRRKLVEEMLKDSRAVIEAVVFEKTKTKKKMNSKKTKSTES